MDKLRNKNTIVLIISAALIVIAIIVAAVATATSAKKADTTTTTNPIDNVTLDLEAIANMNDTQAQVTPDSTQSSAPVVNTTVPTTKQNSYSFVPRKYKVATKDDPLGLRIKPSTESDSIIYVPKGHEVEGIAVWEDWGYVVYEQSGGWLSMNYLELISAN